MTPPKHPQWHPENEGTTVPRCCTDRQSLLPFAGQKTRPVYLTGFRRRRRLPRSRRPYVLLLPHHGLCPFSRGRYKPFPIFRPLFFMSFGNCDCGIPQNSNGMLHNCYQICIEKIYTKCTKRVDKRRFLAYNKYGFHFQFCKADSCFYIICFFGQLYDNTQSINMQYASLPKRYASLRPENRRCREQAPERKLISDFYATKFALYIIFLSNCGLNPGFIRLRRSNQTQERGLKRREIK